MARGVRKAAVDSVAALVGAGQGASVYDWPVQAVTRNPAAESQKRADEIFGGILATRESFTQPQLEMAARFSLLTVEADILLQSLMVGGWTSEKEGRGGKVIEGQNPAAAAFQMVSGELIRLSTKLGLNHLDGDAQTLRNHANLSGGAKLALQESNSPADWVAESRKLKKGKKT